MQPRSSSPRNAPLPPVSAKAFSLKLEELSRGICLDEFNDTPQDRRISKLAADRLLLDRVMLDGYAGKSWERLREALAAYAFQVTRAWLRSGNMFILCARRGPGPQAPLPRGTTGDDVAELASIIVAEALERFREKVLKPGLWNPLQGASLKTYFVGMCVRVFPQFYRAWRTASVRALRFGGTSKIPERPDATPDALAILVAEARGSELVSKDDLPILFRLAADYTSHEIADELGLSPRAVEARVFRMRRPWRTET